MRKAFLIALLLGVVLGVQAQRTTDKLDRGLVAVPSSSGGNFVSWRVFGEEYYDTDYNLYRNGVKINTTPLKVSNFVDAGGNSSSRYQVAPVVRGKEMEKCAEVSRWNSQYYDFPVSPVYGRDGSNVTSSGGYIINDISLADVTGDGVCEFIVKRLSSLNYEMTNKNAFNHIECYNLKGKRLWWIDCGPNILSGSNVELNAVAYDWDGDGKAEVIMRGADNMIIHQADGTVVNIGDMNADTRWSGMEYTNSGREFLLYLNGETGEPYGIGPNGQKWMDYPLPRYDVGETSDLLGSSAEGTIWGAGIAGHRPTKHYFGAPFLDGRHASIFLGRGCYTRHKFIALDVDPQTHRLSERWRWKEYSGSSPWFGNGYHNFGIADVDWDGRDEIVFGSMVIDDNGKGLSTTGLGHGDAQHCGDLDPYRHGQEHFSCNETRPAMNYRDATTSKIYYRLQSTSDDGRALCANFTNDYPGSIGRSTQSGMVSCVADKVVGEKADMIAWGDLNFRIYWDDDLLSEVLNSPGTEKEAAIIKPGRGRLFTTSGCNMCNWTKNTPSAQGDIFGDWREELVLRAEGNTKIRIYTTNIPTTNRIYTLWHDHQYRQAMVWQMCGYNQPPHPSYFLGELEGITQAPPPLTMTGRVEIANGNSISAANNDQHVLVCETNDTKINVADGAAPYIATFNVPSWVQGTNSNSTTNPKINYEYFTCSVSGGAFSGAMRLVKQGDGILELPKVEQKYTGNTDVWAGTLNFDGTLKNSTLWLNRFAELNSDGGVFRSIKMDYDAKLRPGKADNKGMITTDSLVLGFGSRVIFDIYNDLSADQVIAKYVSIETKDWDYGPKYMVPVFEFVAHQGEGETLQAGKYLIGEIEKMTGNLSDIKVEGIDKSLKSYISLEDGKLYLVVEGLREPSSIVWNGNESSTWDLAIAHNFTNAADETLTNEVFVTGDKVLFNDNASNFSVNINSDIEADSVIVDNSKNYVFDGSGAIVGATKLVKKGTGTLTIKTDNSYNGGTRISGGTVIVSSLSNANQALGNLGAMNAASSKMVIENGAELRTTAAVTQGSAMSVLTEEGGVINNTGDYIVNRSITGTKLTKKGGGWMKLNTTNPSLERLVIAGGTVQCVSCNVPARTVEFNSGTLSENTGSNYAIHIPEGKSGTWNLVNDATYSNKLTGEGTISISCPVRSGGSGSSAWYATRTRISGNWSEFQGTVKPVSNGDPSGRFTLDNSSGMPHGTMDIASGVEVQNSAKSFAIGKLTGSGSLGGVCSFSSGGVSGNNTWRVGNDESWRWSGTVVGNGTQFVKVGSGKIIASGAWTNTGAVTVQEGELNISSTTSLGTGTLTVSKDGILSGVTSSTKSLTNSSYTINGTLQIGVTAASYSGIMNFGSKNVSFSSGSTLIANVLRAANNSSKGGTFMGQINRLVMNGTIVVSLYKNYAPEVGDSIVLWEANTFSGSPKFELPATYEKVNSETGETVTYSIEWDTSDISKGILRVAGVTDGIQRVMSLDKTNGTNDVYNTQGALVKKNAQSLRGLPKGIYFWQGRKVVVK